VTILDDICSKRRATVRANREWSPEKNSSRTVSACRPLSRFHAALAGHDEVRFDRRGETGEPLAGLIREDFDSATNRDAVSNSTAPRASAADPTNRSSRQPGITCEWVRQTVDLPVLRKGFHCRRIQYYKPAPAVPIAFLLIAECPLTRANDSPPMNKPPSLGMQTLIELFEPDNLAAVLARRRRWSGSTIAICERSTRSRSHAALARDIPRPIDRRRERHPKL